MQDHETQERTNCWPLSKIVAVIGVALLLCAAAYMAYVAIDAQAFQASLSR